MGEKKEMAPLDSVHSPCRWLRHFLQPLYLFPPMDFGCIMGHWFVKKDGALQASQVVPVVKNLPVNAGDTDSIPGLGRSPGEGNGNPLQYSYLENSMDRRAVGYGPPGCKELDMTEWLSTAQHSGTKRWIRCTIKFLVKMKNASFILLKNRRSFLASPTNDRARIQSKPSDFQIIPQLISFLTLLL